MDNLNYKNRMYCLPCYRRYGSGIYIVYRGADLVNNK